MSNPTSPGGLRPEPGGTGVPTVAVDRLQDWLERGEKVTVLDVRPAVERAEWHIPRSVHQDVYDALKRGDPEALDAYSPPARVPVVAVCEKGRTSLIATALLRQRGVEAYSLEGGMRAWSLAWNTAELAGENATLIQVRRTGKGCLSYLVGSAGEAVVIDASLDPIVYLQLAQARGWSIRHVFDTHVHADHLSRSRRLAELAGARFWLPEQHRVHFTHEEIREGTRLPFGGTEALAIHTPGHTLESTSYVVNGRWLLTGDTLFPESVGRPDLEAGIEQARARALLLHRSLGRLFALEPGLLVLPCHASSPVPFDHKVPESRLGEVRRAIRFPGDAAAFAEDVLRRIPPTPPNHDAIIALNEAGELPTGDPTELEAGANRCALS